MANRKLIVEIVGDEKDLVRAFKNSTRATQKFSLGLGTIAKGAVGFLAIQKGATLAGDAIRAGIDEFSQSRRVQAQTAAVLKSTGGVAKVTAGQVNALAGSLSRLSGIDDELVQTGENLLLTFKNVRNEAGKGNAIFDRATRAAIDLSVAGFGSVETTSKQLGKALNDPVRGLTALNRAGVTFTEAQKKQIKALVDTGHQLEAQKVLLREVESQVGGSARALGETLPGKLNRLRETFKNVAGDVVARFEPAINDAADAVVKWLSKTKNQERIQRDIARATDVVVAAMKALVSVLKTLRAILEPVVRLLGGAENAVKALLAVMVASKVVSFAQAFTGLSTQALVATGRVSALRLAMLRLGAIGVITLGVEVIINRREITKKLNELTDSLPGPKGGTVDLTKMNLQELVKLRDKLKGFSGPLVGELDKAIKRAQKLESTLGGLKSASIVEEGRLRSPGKKIAKAIADSFAFVQKAVDDATAKASTGSAAAKKVAKKQKDAVDDLVKSLSPSDQAEAAAKANAARLARIQADQFKALGLTAEGDQRTPGIKNLRKQLGQLTDRLGDDVAPKIKGQLARIRKVLADPISKATVETRKKIVEMFETIRATFDQESGKGLALHTRTRAINRNAILKGLGLDPETEKIIKQRLQGFNTAGRKLAPAAGTFGAFGIAFGANQQPINITTEVVLDGQKVGRSVTKHQQRAKRGNPPQKRGPMAGM